MLRNKLIILFFFILLALEAAAYYTIELGEYHASADSIRRDDFDFHAYQDPYMLCAGERKIIPIWIVNKDETKDFFFRLKNIDFAGMSGSGLVLDPDQEAVLFVELLAPQNLRKNLTFYLEISTDGQLSLRLPIRLNVQQCYGVAVDINESTVHACACESERHYVHVTNTGKSDELFNIYLDAPSFVSIANSSATIMVPAGSTEIVGFDVGPSCETEGKYTLRMAASLARGESIADYDDVEIRVHRQNKCYEPAVTATDFTSDYGKSYHQIEIANKGAKEAEYALAIEGASWVSIDSESIMLRPGEKRGLSILVEPPTDITEGEYPIRLLMQSQGQEYFADFQVRLKRGNSFLDKTMSLIHYYRFYIYLGLVLLAVLLAIMIAYKKMPKKRKLDKKRWSWGAIPAAIIILVAMIIIFFRPIFSFVSYYRYYFLAGIGFIILLAILAFLPKKTTKKVARKRNVWSLLYATLSVLILAGLAAYLLFNYLENIKSFFGSYWLFILIGLGVLAVVLFIYSLSRKIRLNKRSIRKMIAAAVTLSVLAATIYAVFYFDWIPSLQEFFVIYMYYIIAGFAILVLVILLLTYFRKIVDFFWKKDE